METPRAIYRERIDRVIEYVQAHLDQPLSLDRLAGVAFFSSFHFHRIFQAVTGDTLNFFTNRLRLEKAARLLMYSSSSATDIALECGFSSSRPFRARLNTISAPRRASIVGPAGSKKARFAKNFSRSRSIFYHCLMNRNTCMPWKFFWTATQCDWEYFDLDLCIPVKPLRGLN